jgi:hypothetical protein
MISPLVSKVKLPHLVESAAHRDCSVVEGIGECLRLPKGYEAQMPFKSEQF